MSMCGVISCVVGKGCFLSPVYSFVLILIPDKIDFNPKIVIRDKEGHYILVSVN